MVKNKEEVEINSEKTVRFSTRGNVAEVLAGTEHDRPQIKAGICEACGSVHLVGKNGDAVHADPHIDAKGVMTYKYPTGTHPEAINATKCKHYNGVNIMCSFCGERFTGQISPLGQFEEVLGSRTLRVYSLSNTPNELVMYCDDFECKRKAEKELGISL